MKRRNLICLLAAVLACLLLLAGCSADDTVEDEKDDNALTDETQTDDTSTTDDTQSDDNLTGDTLGEVIYLGDGYFELMTCDVPEAAGDYTSLDLSALTADGAYDYIYPDENTVYYLLSDGVLASAAAEDIAVGDLVVQTTADDGECRIIILQKAESAA